MSKGTFTEPSRARALMNSGIEESRRSLHIIINLVRIFVGLFVLQEIISFHFFLRNAIFYSIELLLRSTVDRKSY